jgi:hypothetical protein
MYRFRQMASCISTTKILRLPRGPRLGPELTPPSTVKRFSRHESSRGPGEVDAGFRNVPRRVVHFAI